MANWALVIGVDHYPNAPRLSLKGAVRDALAMAELLLAGPTPLIDSPDRLILLLSRTTASPAVPGSLPFRPASQAEITKAVKEIAKKRGEKLFLHFSGHGIQAPGLSEGHAILPEEYQPDLTTASIEVAGILAYLRIAHFDEQFVFIDACRNIPVPGDFNVGPFALKPKAEEVRPAVKQYVFRATSRGVKANELRMKENEEGGVFSLALVRGLRGEGEAKRYDPDGDRYLVTVGRLLHFVRARVKEAVTELELAAEGEFPQEPRLDGDLANTEAVVRVVRAEDVPKARLQFAVIPAEAGAVARVGVLGDEVDEEFGPPIEATTAAELAQRAYRVKGVARGYEPLKRSWPTELYGDATVTLRFRRAEGLGTPLGLFGFGDGGEEDFRPKPASRFAETTGTIVARTLDPLALVQVVDSQGKVVAVGRRRVEQQGLRPGIYRCQVLTPGGAAGEQMVALDAGERVELPLDSPPAESGPVMEELRRAGEIPSNSDSSLRILETLGAPAAALMDVPGLLAMGEMAGLVVEALEPVERLRQMGLNVWRELRKPRQAAAVQLSVVDEGSGELRAAKVRIWPVGKAKPRAATEQRAGTTVENVGRVSAAVGPGTHLLELRGEGRESLVFAVPALTGWVTALIVHRPSGGETAASCFFLREEEGTEREILLQRRLQLAQRFFQSGGYGDVIRILAVEPGDQDGAILNRHEDPMAELLLGYAHLRLALSGDGDGSGLRAAAGHLQERFAGLADTSVLAAEARFMAGETAEAECRDALDKGLPLFWFGALRLLAMAGRYSLAHKNLPLLERAVNRRAGSSALLSWRG
jgi:hypothetical protein